MKRSLILAAAIALATIPFGANAHKAWLRPSQTVLAGTDGLTTNTLGVVAMRVTAMKSLNVS